MLRPQVAAQGSERTTADSALFHALLSLSTTSGSVVFLDKAADGSIDRIWPLKLHEMG